MIQPPGTTKNLPPTTSNLNNSQTADAIPDELQLDLHRSKNENRIIPFRFFAQPKPMHARHKGETYTIEGTVNIITQYDDWVSHLKEGPGNGIIIEPKYDGVRLQIHKLRSKIHAWTEDGTDVTLKIPSILNQLKQNPHNFVLEGELELWNKNSHIQRAKATAILNTKKLHENESNARFTICDVMWLDGEDIHTMPYNYRSKAYVYFKNHQNIKTTQQKGATSVKQLSKLITEFSNLEGSEGAMLKLPGHKYSLTGTTRGVLKYKNELSLDVMIIKSTPVKNSSTTFNHECAVIDTEGNAVPIGSTFNTTILSNTNIIQVAFSELAEYMDPHTNQLHFKWIHPRVIEAREDKTTPDTAATAHEIVVETNGQVGTKKYPKITSNQTPIPITKNLIEGTIGEPIIDCGCNNKLDIKFKIQQHTTHRISNNKLISHDYHLLFEMPTRHLDFTSTLSPLTCDSTTTDLNKVSTANWNADGILSPNHKLNPTRYKLSITQLDEGIATYFIGPTPTQMDFKLKGKYINDSITIKKQLITKMWDFSKIPQKQ